MRRPKNSGKSSDEDRGRKKKIKSKSAKRRREPSTSSTSSSGSEIDARSRRRGSKSKKMEKRRKEKRSERRRSRKKRYRRDSSVSSFSSDSGRRCSTCFDSERSKSPVRRSTSRKGEKERGRTSSRSRHKFSPSVSYRSQDPIEGSHRKRSRHRYTSSSSSSGRKSCGHSPIAEPTPERYGNSHARSPPTEENLPIEYSFAGSHEHRYVAGESSRLRSVVAVIKASEENGDEGNKNGNMDGENPENDSYIRERKEDVGPSNNKLSPVEDSDAGGAAIEASSMPKNSEVSGEEAAQEAVELELLLRQKALENLKKFRGVHPLNKESPKDIMDESAKCESTHVSQKSLKSSEANPSSSVGDQEHVQQGTHQNKMKAILVDNTTTKKVDKKAHEFSNNNDGSKPVTSSVANQNTLNQSKRVVEPSLTAGRQSKQIVSPPNSGSRAQVDTVDKPAADAHKEDNQKGKGNEPTVESASGSQFEKKTFSRVCDGETVQVSYKVYIPKRTPALARRQLQRI